jgi:S1-C subfamily serine protease
LQGGDVIIRADGIGIDRPADLTRAIRDRRAGDTIQLEVLRDGSSRTMTVELADSPHTFSFSFRGDGEAPFGGFVLDGDALHEEMERLQEHLGELDLDIDIPGFAFRLGDPGRPLLGIQAIQPTPELREHLGGDSAAGILVGKVHPDSPAAEAGLRVGDLLVSVDGNEVRDAGDLSRGLRKARGAYVDLGILRDGSPMTLRAFIPEPAEPSRRFAPSEPLRAPLLEAPTLQRS